MLIPITQYKIIGFLFILGTQSNITKPNKPIANIKKFKKSCNPISEHL